MENIAVVLQHNGEWDENRNYIKFEVCGLLIPSNCNFNYLVGIICNELKLNLQPTDMKIEYQVKDGYPPFNILDDAQLKFYIELKKREPDFTRYPLSLTIEIKSIPCTSQSTRSETTNDGLCIQVEQLENEDSNSIQEQLEGEIVEYNVADYVDYAENICQQIIEIQNVESNGDETIQLNKEMVISNKNHDNLEVGQLYKDKETLKNVLSHYAISNNFQFYVQKSCKRQYRINCVDESCKWMLRASRNGQTSQFVIRKLNNIHSCALEIRFKDQRQASTRIIADIIKNKFSNIRTKYTVADIIRDINHDHKVQVNYAKAWRSKEKALEIMRGNATGSYGELVCYLYMLHRTNPGSRVELKADDNKCFLYVFVALNASMKGWIHCVPVVVVDGTFLKSAHGGTLLVAATQDAGGKIFPLAFCVVDSENDTSWEWFFDTFRKAYGLRPGMNIISDRHESIIKAVNKVYPEVSHGFCIFHILSNMKSKFKKNSKSIKDTFFSAANAYTVKKFEYHMKEIAKIDKRIQPFLENIGYDKWARVHSQNNRYSNMTSNIAESLNAVITSIRELPVCTMLEALRALVQKWSWSNRNIAHATTTRLTKKFEDLLKKNFHYSINLMVHPTTSVLFEVHNDAKIFVVDIALRKCTCNRFQMDVLPCAHAIAVLQKVNHDPYDYCSQYYTKQSMLAAYEEVVYPVGNKDTWDVPPHISSMIVYPPEGRTRVGRPKKRRCKASWENNIKSTQQLKCGRCSQYGHNKRTCRNPPQREMN